MSNTVTLMRTNYLPKVRDAKQLDADLEPFASLFLKPLTDKKSLFSRKELEAMCKDPLHSPRLILYLIDCVKAM